MTDKDRFIAALISEGERRDPRWRVGQEPQEAPPDLASAPNSSAATATHGIGLGNQERAPDAKGEPLPQHGPECAYCGVARRDSRWTVDTLPACVECATEHAGPTQLVAWLPDPFDPSPPAKAKAIDGFIRCATCESVVSAVGHECATPDERFERLLSYRDRAEFAESLLCALSWDHAIDLDNGWVECGPCVYCDAARTGGRP